VIVVDARPAPQRAEVGFDGRAYALAIASKRLLQGIAIWPEVEALAQPILKIKASDGVAGQGASRGAGSQGQVAYRLLGR
jgi:2-octaprenyl-6-methoxyphenol hydroxylase